MSTAIDEGSLEWMPKSVWGPIKWKELHTRAMINQPMEGEGRWFEAFVRGLPCAKCRHHFEAFLTENPAKLTSRAEFFAWTVAAHNAVNRQTGKGEISIAEAYQIHAYRPDEE